jgi:hypothetical protein
MENDYIEYNIYVSHRDGPQDMGKPLKAQTNLLQYMRDLYLDMGLGYERKITPVAIPLPLNAIAIDDRDALGGYNAFKNNQVSQFSPNFEGSTRFTTVSEKSQVEKKED